MRQKYAYKPFVVGPSAGLRTGLSNHGRSALKTLTLRQAQGERNLYRNFWRITLASFAALACSGSKAVRSIPAFRSPLAAGGIDHQDQSSTPTIRLASAIDVMATTIGNHSFELPPPGASIQRP